MAQDANPELPALPTGFSGELLFSRVARFHVLSGGGPDKETTSRLFGSRFAVTASGLPNRLQALCSYFGERETAHAIADESTLYPYYRPFLPEDRADELLSAMLGADARGLKSRLGLLASRVGASNALRLCRQCVVSDEQRRGVAYWHRVHQVPGVLVCPIHQLPLDDCTLATAHSRHALWLPRNVPQALIRQSLSFTAQQKAALLEIATGSSAVIDAALPPLGPSRLWAIYVERAAEIGITAGTRRIRQAEFLDGFHEKWGCLANLQQFRAIVNEEISWPASLLREHRRSFHPLKHLLVALTLFQDHSDLLDRFAKATPDAEKIFRTSVSTGTSSGNKSRSMSSDRAAAALKLVTEERLSLRAVAKRLGLDTTTARLYVQAGGGVVSRRRKHLSEAIEAEVAAQLEEGDDIADIADERGLSYSSVWRVLAASPSLRTRRDDCIRQRDCSDYRARWEATLMTSAVRGVKLAREADAAAYAWLYRNDREWLKSANAAWTRRPTSIRGHRADWPTRDRAAAVSILRVAAALAAQAGPPTRMSAARIARRAGVSALVEKHAQRVPNAIAALNCVAEGVAAFQARRARYWSSYLEAQGIQPAQWRIDRLAGMPRRIP